MSDPARIKEFLQYRGEFMGYLMAMTRDLDAAEEIFQNAAVVILEEPMDLDIRDFRAWVKGILRRRALKYFSQKRRAIPAAEPKLLEQISVAFEEDATPQDRARQELDALRACLSDVPEKSRAMFELRYERKASFDEIGRQLTTTATAVQRAISRLRKSLYDCVQHRIKTSGEVAR